MVHALVKRVKGPTAFRLWSWFAYIAESAIVLLGVAGALSPHPWIFAIIQVLATAQKRATDNAEKWEKPRRPWSIRRYEQQAIQKLYQSSDYSKEAVEILIKQFLTLPPGDDEIGPDAKESPDQELVARWTDMLTKRQPRQQPNE